CPFFHRPAAWPHTHHVHVVEAGGEEERRTLAFRDYLRAHPEVAREYAELKMRLARGFRGGDLPARAGSPQGESALLRADHYRGGKVRLKPGRRTHQSV